jgi:PAS domain S-box-containing protein
MSSDRDEDRLAPARTSHAEQARAATLAKERAEEALRAVKTALDSRSQELLHSLALMSAALEATADGIIATDSDGAITGFNEQYLRMFRVDRSLVERHDHHYVVAHISSQLEDPEAFRARIKEIYTTAPPDSFDELRMRDGRVYERFSKVQLVNGEQVGRVWSFRDVTAHVQAQEQLRSLNQRLGRRVEERTDALRKSEQQFLQLVLGVEDVAIYMIDTTGLINTWNPGAERIKGYASEEIVGKHFSVFYTDEDRARHTPEHALSIATQKGKYEAEGWRVRKDGSRFWASVLVDAIRDSSGKLLGFAKITRDMTEWRAMQEQLHQAQKMEAIGQLTGGVAHDFNNLLTVILGNLDTIGRLTPPQDARLKRAVDQATRGAQRAATLTQQLLAFSRRQPLNPKPTEVNRLVSGISELIRRTLNENISIETVLGAGVWRIEIDAHQLESALLNLAVNARDAMKNGGKLTIETANAHLDERYAANYAEIDPGQYVVICVSDTGTGMSKDVLARAFDPFYTTKPIGQGTGLGLSQVYGFVKQSGGHVKLYSEVGEGTTVKIYLPRYTGGQVDLEPEPQPYVPQGASREVILVVEDDDDVRQFSSDSLRELGFSVLEANDGPSALRVLELRPDVKMLFTDVGLPGINGRELVEAARKRRPQLKVLFTSGYARNAIVHQGRLDQGVQLLTKPFTRAQLAARVRDVLDSKDDRQVQGKVALVVEDEPLVRLFLVQTIEQLGYEVLEAATAAQARAELDSRNDIDVAFMDIGLPDGNGVELATSFSPKHPAMRIILASGYSQPAYEVTNENPRISFVSKPFDANAIRSALAEA